MNRINNIKDNCYFVLQFMSQARIIINRDNYENDGLFIDNAYYINPSPKVYNNDKSIEVKYNTFWTVNQKKKNQQTNKPRYSTVQRITVSQEMTSNQELKDVRGHVFDSDVFDDSTDFCSKNLLLVYHSYILWLKTQDQRIHVTSMLVLRLNFVEDIVIKTTH